NGSAGRAVGPEPTAMPADALPAEAPPSPTVLPAQDTPADEGPAAPSQMPQMPTARTRAWVRRAATLLDESPEVAYGGQGRHPGVVLAALPLGLAGLLLGGVAGSALLGLFGLVTCAVKLTQPVEIVAV